MMEVDCKMDFSFTTNNNRKREVRREVNKLVQKLELISKSEYSNFKLQNFQHQTRSNLDGQLVNLSSAYKFQLTFWKTKNHVRHSKLGSDKLIVAMVPTAQVPPSLSLETPINISAKPRTWTSVFPRSRLHAARRRRKRNSFVTPSCNHSRGH